MARDCRCANTEEIWKVLMIVSFASVEGGLSKPVIPALVSWCLELPYRLGCHRGAVLFMHLRICRHLRPLHFTHIVSGSVRLSSVAFCRRRLCVFAPSIPIKGSGSRDQGQDSQCHSDSYACLRALAEATAPAGLCSGRGSGRRGRRCRFWAWACSRTGARGGRVAGALAPSHRLSIAFNRDIEIPTQGVGEPQADGWLARELKVAAEWFERIVERKVETTCCRRCFIVHFIYVSDYEFRDKDKMDVVIRSPSVGEEELGLVTPHQT